MDIVALVISIIALILGSVAYLRSGGREDIRAAQKTLKGTIEELGSLVHQTREQMAATVRAGYERSIRAIGAMQSQLAELKKGAAEEMRADIDALERTLEQLAERAARELEEVKTSIGRAVVEAEEAMRRAVEEARARLAVIEAKEQLALARLAVARNNLIDAQSHLNSALSHLKTARSLSGRFMESIVGVQNEAQRLLNESRVKAETLDSLIEQNNRLLSEMSADRTGTTSGARTASALSAR